MTCRRRPLQAADHKRDLLLAQEALTSVRHIDSMGQERVVREALTSVSEMPSSWPFTAPPSTPPLPHYPCAAFRQY